MEEYAYSPRRSLYSGPCGFGDSQTSPEFGLQNVESFYGSSPAGRRRSRMFHMQELSMMLLCFFLG